MVVSALVQLAIAGPTGILFGLGYGTAIRVGYEIIYPALFGDKSIPKDKTSILKKIEEMYTSVGGLEAHKFGINQGIKNALKAIDSDPELVDLIKKNSALDTQNITVNLSGTSMTQLSGDVSVPPSPQSVDIPPGLTMGILSYVQALARAAQQQKLDDYVELVEMIGLSDDKLYWLVKNGNVSIRIAGYTVRIEWGLLTLGYQQSLIPRFNKINEARIAVSKPQGPQTAGGGLLGGVEAVGVKWTKAAGQSQRMEKTKLIAQIRDMKRQIGVINKLRGTSSLGEKSYQSQIKLKIGWLKGFQQSLANLLARYRF